MFLFAKDNMGEPIGKNETPPKERETKEQETKEQERQNVFREIRHEANNLQLAVWGADAVEQRVSDIRDTDEKQPTTSEKKTPEQQKQVEQEISELIKNKDWIGLLAKAGAVIDYFFGSFRWLFFSDGGKKVDAKLQKTMEMPNQVDFATMDDKQLTDFISQMQLKIERTTHTYKRLHLLRCMSRAKDEQQKRSGPESKNQFEKMKNQLQNWDIVLFGNNGDFWNWKLIEKTQNPFAHIGIYHQWKFIHSTMNWSILNPAWWMSVDMQSYMQETRPRGCVILRPTQGERIGATAEQMVSAGQIQYDTLWALQDINSDSQSDNGKYNCAEFVAKVVESVTGISIPDSKDALPGTYLDVPQLTPVYMDWYTGASNSISIA